VGSAAEHSASFSAVRSPIGRFIADFLAPSSRLSVEVDGGYHQRRRVADGRRDRDLNRFGYRVLRLPARLVMAQPSQGLGLVAAALVVA
jgi:very-short-patch-repair endonuclease